jgi:hypothetical protein
MSTTEVQELTHVWEQIRNWPTRLQISLARRILDTVDAGEPAGQTPPTESREKRGRPVAELVGLGAGSRAPPSDEQIRQWIEEHSTEKYGP